MFTPPTEKIRAQKATAPKTDKEPRDQGPSPPFRVQTSPQNDAVPAEILIDIFDALIAISKDSSPKVIQTLRLVCRSWKNASRGMELLRISISSPRAMDALLKHIRTTPLFQMQKRAKIRFLELEPGYLHGLHRAERLLPLCRTSLQRLVLDRHRVHISSVGLLMNAEQEAAGTFYFPNITSLSLTKLGPRELYNVIMEVDPSRLESLQMHDTLVWYDYIPEELNSLRFVLLQKMIIYIFCKDETPTVPWLFRVAPNLEILEISICRPSLPTLTRSMSNEDILGSLKNLKLWIIPEPYDYLDPKCKDLAPLVAVIKRRGWKQWICVCESYGKTVYE